MKTCLEERFWKKVKKTKKCWNWIAGKRNGYGNFWNGVFSEPAHRFSYKLLIGDIPEGLVLDHLCRNHSCVNPKHLEIVTQRVNTLRGVGPSAINSKKTHCKNGHKIFGDNLKIVKGKYGLLRYCKICFQKRTCKKSMKYYYKKRNKL